MMGLVSRRHFITTGLALIAAPAIVRAESLMPVRAIAPFPIPDLNMLSVHEWTEQQMRKVIEQLALAQEDMILYGSGAVEINGPFDVKRINLYE